MLWAGRDDINHRSAMGARNDALFGDPLGVRSREGSPDRPSRSQYGQGYEGRTAFRVSEPEPARVETPAENDAYASKDFQSRMDEWGPVGQFLWYIVAGGEKCCAMRDRGGAQDKASARRAAQSGRPPPVSLFDTNNRFPDAPATAAPDSDSDSPRDNRDFDLRSDRRKRDDPTRFDRDERDFRRGEVPQPQAPKFVSKPPTASRRDDSDSDHGSDYHFRRDEPIGRSSLRPLATNKQSEDDRPGTIQNLHQDLKPASVQSGSAVHPTVPNLHLSKALPSADTAALDQTIQDLHANKAASTAVKAAPASIDQTIQDLHLNKATPPAEKAAPMVPNLHQQKAAPTIQNLHQDKVVPAAAAAESSTKRWEWPAWCLNFKTPSIEVYVVDEDSGETRWMKAEPQSRVVDTTGKDAYLCAEYEWDDELYVQDFGPNHVRKRGSTRTVMDEFNLANASASKRNDTGGGVTDFLANSTY